LIRIKDAPDKSAQAARADEMEGPMAYKSILSALTGTAALAPTLRAAARLCAAQDGHLDVLGLGVDRVLAGYSYMGLDMGAVQVALERAEQDAGRVAAAARAALGAESPTLRATVEAASVQQAALAQVIGHRARFADLVILPRPYGTEDEAGAEAVLEAALFDGRAPVLVPPDGAELEAEPKHVVVAWNQSAEAMAAVRHALPFLRQAEAVTLCVIDPPRHGPERSDPGGALCQMLVRHGVRAEVTVLAQSLPRLSDVLLRHVTDQKADLLVMGAYGHSRLREAILGGATRDVLEGAPVAVLMAH
jgi:nucleotide-binding universal stress UspA family protein